MWNRIIFVCVAVVFFILPATGQPAAGSNTLKYDSLQASPAATIEDLHWLSGYWVGTAPDTKSEEIWTPPSGSCMMGSFKLVKNGQVNFYELQQICEEGGSLSLKIRHFSSDFQAWEQDGEKFPLVKLFPAKAYFDGLTYQRLAEDKLIIYVLQEGEFGASELKFEFQRQQL